MNKTEFSEWWPQNAHLYTAERDFGDISFTAGFLPYQYFESRQEEVDEKAERSEAKMVAVELRYALTNGENVMYSGIRSEEQYLTRLKYFQEDFKTKCKLKYGETTSPCKDLHIQPTSGITPFTSIMLYFSVSEKQIPDEAILIFRDELFDTGIVKIRIENLNKIPAIKNA